MISATRNPQPATRKKAKFSIIGSEKAKYHRSFGFTLIEMLVVIGLIALLATWAFPGIRKAYQDFIFRKSAENLDILYSSMRAYYLVFSEFPEDSSSNLIQTKAAWALPSNFYTRTLNNTTYYLNVRPYEGNIDLAYDVDNHLLNNENIKTFSISIKQTGNTTTNHWLSYLEKRYPDAPKRIYGGSTLLSYPEVAVQYVPDEKIHRNRYY